MVGLYADLGVPSGGGSSQMTRVGGFAKTTVGSEKLPARLFSVRAWGGTSPLAGIKQVFDQSIILFSDGRDAAELQNVATKADVVVVYVEQFATEAEDEPDLVLAEEQNALIDSITRLNKKVVVLLQTGNPVQMPC